MYTHGYMQVPYLPFLLLQIQRLPTSCDSPHLERSFLLDTSDPLGPELCCQRYVVLFPGLGLGLGRVFLTPTCKISCFGSWTSEPYPVARLVGSWVAGTLAVCHRTADLALLVISQHVLVIYSFPPAAPRNLPNCNLSLLGDGPSCTENVG